jgi:hypothetical protein
MSITVPRGPRFGFPSRHADGDTVAIPGVTVLSAHDAWELYDAECREYLGMPADEFERLWKRGDLRARQEDPAVRRVLMIRVAKP